MANLVAARSCRLMLTLLVTLRGLDDVDAAGEDVVVADHDVIIVADIDLPLPLVKELSLLQDKRTFVC